MAETYGPVSKDKFTKDGRPKRSGNFSKLLMHYTHKDYPCSLHADGTIIIGSHTPGETLLLPAIIELMRTDKFFKQYRQDGKYNYQGKTYPCWRIIYKNYFTTHGASDFTFTMGIDTKGDFNFKFPEY